MIATPRLLGTPCSAAAAAAAPSSQVRRLLGCWRTLQQQQQRGWATPRRHARLQVAASAGQGRPPPAGDLRSPAGQAQRQAILGRIDHLINEELQSDSAVS